MQRIGIVGIGNISGIYLKNLSEMFGKRVKVTAAADIIFERAQKAALDYNIRAFKTADELVNSDEVDIVLNITPPNSHYEVALAAVKAGKHIYTEKPLCAKREEAAEILKIAAEKKVRVGGAPDTFLGAGFQTCRKLIDDGWIGAPVAAAAVLMSHGPEHWHPNPHFFYKDGGGPMFDMGPYYITALVSLLGPVSRVSGSARISTPTRTITNSIQYGDLIEVKVPTHIAATLDFAGIAPNSSAGGPVATLITSFDVYSHSLPCIEIYGTEGTLKAPDPNTFGGPVFVRRMREDEWYQIPLIKNYPENSRGLGITDMAEAIEENRPHRANGELAFHVLDVMHSIHDASVLGKYIKLKPKLKRPEAMGK